MSVFVVVSSDPSDPDQAEMPVGEYLITVAADGTPFLAYRRLPTDHWGVPSKGVAAP